MLDERYRQMGAKIKYYRTINKMDQTAFAAAVGITPQYLSRIERGDAKPSTDLLFQIADKLDVEISAIMKSEAEV